MNRSTARRGRDWTLTAFRSVDWTEPGNPTPVFDPFDGWKSDGAREKWRKDGAAVVARLRAEVADYADVKYEPWPLGSWNE